ncbi:hypothetical protein QYE77_14665 (plasmid) [Thermanaerothrix sp. 4228-RoL]|jgi:hypothetical protein|uniref:Uncharacterized protein n=1 Tax=Thermanaerothrix solaris TaxID=3058434 RepID=A0ABU3NRM9_9CHLR|nr:MULTISPECIES: hypothetical protein [unclassified Thermanaerothrix]MDT8899504.1 hypothetical protein [Thermanaerothrix sp. 4228-RoL]
MEYVVLIIAATYFILDSLFAWAKSESDRKIREDAMIAKRLSEIMER